MIDTDAVAAACEEMKKQGYSLVLVCGRWSFAKGPRLFPENPELEEPLIRAGDILRMGHWSSPIHALEDWGRALMRRT